MSSSKHSTNILNTTIHQSAPTEPTSTSTSTSGPPSSGSGTSRITSDGSIVQTADPSTQPSAPLAQKLKGNMAGAAKGTMGSLQAAAGAVVRNEGMRERGEERMVEEDERLGAKRGVMPVGTGLREGRADVDADAEGVGEGGGPGL